MVEVVLVEIKGDIAIVTLNRPDAMNALSAAVFKALATVFNELQQNDQIAVVILTGAGRAFTAGLDLQELSELGMDGFLAKANVDLQAAVLNFDRPIIGAINGVAATGGFEMALWCDVLVASTQARFADTHARVGIIPGWGLSQRLQRIIGINRARELSFTGNFLSAEKAETWGLVNRVVSAEQLLPVCEQLAADMASCDRATLIRYKRVINDGAGMDLSSALAYEGIATEMHAATQSAADIAARRSSVANRGSAQAAD